jgi:IS66 Orf2 like protein
MSRVEVISSPERRRRWSEDKKRAIARRVDVVPGLIYRWRRQFWAAAVGFARVTVTPDEPPSCGFPALEVEFGCEYDDDAEGIGVGGHQGSGRMMIALPSGVRVWIAAGHTDMRRGMQRLARQVQEVLQRDPHLCVGCKICDGTVPRPQ